MEIAQHWRLKAQRYRLEGSLCTICGQLTFPPRPICPHCVDQVTWIVGGAAPVFLTSIGLTGIELHRNYQSTERMIR